MVQPGASGLLVEPKDEHALAASLVELINSPQMRQEMGQRGRAHAEAYSWPRVAGQVLDYYERLLGEREPGRLPKEE